MRYTDRRQKRNDIKNKRGAIIDRVGVDKRPRMVEQRLRIGDIEVYLMMGRHYKSAVLVMTDRATLVTMIEKLSSKNADEVYQKMNERLTNFDSAWIKTIIFDNAKEFTRHLEIAKDINAKSTFTRPYTSQDKGTVENRIGLIRRFFSKENRP